jgi:predicted kinase
VTGHPATGKTTLAEALGEALRLPVFHKDVIKESMADVLGFDGARATSQRLGHAATVLLYDIAERTLSGGGSLVLESNFPAEFASAPLRASVESSGASAVQIVLRARNHVMMRRFAARRRHPVHVLRAIGPLGRYEPLDLPGRLLDVDTTRLPVDLEAIVDFVNEG